MLKHIPEDFIVEEIPKFPPQSEGAYAYFMLRKRNLNTQDAIMRVASAFKVKQREVGCAGAKDRRAVTHQLISVKARAQGDVRISDDLALHFIGRGSTPVSLGDLNGNAFTINVRALDDAACARIDANSAHLRRAGSMLTNYFDEQRFGSSNVEVGRALMRKDYRAAIDILIDRQNSPYAARMREYLSSYPHDFLGAVRLLPRRLLLLFVHAVQSHLWNETVTAYLAKSANLTARLPYSRGEFLFPCARIENVKVPLVGFGTDVEDEGMGLIVKGVLEEHALRVSDFINRSLPEVSVEGTERALLMYVKDLVVSEPQDDELNAGKKKVTLAFALPPGSYATLVARFLVEAPEHG